jgi:autotransporter-associated beta strand protein
MIGTWWQKLAKRKVRRVGHGSKMHIRGTGSGRLELEWLESRLAPATHTWTGATSDLWSVASNWTGGSPAGDASAVLVFPSGAMNLSTMNDLTNLTAQGITVSGNGYTLSGNQLILTGGGITLDSMVTTSTTTVGLPIVLGATQTWTVTNPSAILQVDGVISGGAPAGLTLAGGGSVTLTGTNSYTGTTTVAGGSLLVNGSQPGSNVTVETGATLGGSGTVGAITASGIISPGGPGAGVLHSSDVIFNAGSSLLIGITGTVPGTSYSQLSVTGTVDLSSSPTLSVTLGSSTPAVGTTFMPLVSTGAITGTFSGLPDNSTLTLSGRNLRVNYQPNDVLLTLTSVNSITTVTSSANPAVFGQPVTFTATVVSATLLPSILPTGTVTFLDGTTMLGTGTLNANGLATFSPSTPLSLGTHSITAAYSGDSNFATSTSAPLMQTITLATTTVSVTSSANPSILGQPVTFTASVTPTTPSTTMPTGMVTFKEGTNTLGTSSLNASGVATLTETSPLSAGMHSITAVYSGDSNFATGTSMVFVQTVNLGATMTLITSSQNPATAGQSVVFTATVSPVAPATGTPTGSVTFKDGTTTLGTATLSSGQATFSTSSLVAGAHSIVAVYSGDSNFSTSTSSVLVQTISLSPSANLNYVTQLYHDLLGRAPDSGGLTFWTNLLNQGQATQYQVALAFTNSPEYRMVEVESLYTKYLHRAVDPTGLSTWTQYLLQGHTFEQLEAQIVASQEYVQTRLGGNTNNFLSTLIMDTFNRPSTQADVNAFGSDYSGFNDRVSVAENVFASTEYRQDLVESYFQTYLGRSADPVGLNASVAAMQNGMPDETVIAVIVSSPEYISTRVP